MSQTVPNVLAARYASADMGRAVVARAPSGARAASCGWPCSEAQAELGIEVPEGAVDAYGAVVDQVDLASIDARERVTRHDVKARIEEFSALAGHEQIHKGMTSRDLTENVEQLQVRDGPRGWSAAGWWRPWPGWPSGRPSTPPLVMTGRSHNVPAQATTLGKRFANAGEELLLALAPRRRPPRPLPAAGHQGPGRHPAGHARPARRRRGRLDELEQRVAGAPRASTGSLDQRGPGLPPVARPRRGVGPGAGGRRARQPGHHHPADGRPGAGHRGLPARPGRAPRPCPTR